MSEEVVILPEMVAAGVAAWEESEQRGFDKPLTVQEIYMAMYGEAIKSFGDGPQTIQ